jgi:hypothetical protein
VHVYVERSSVSTAPTFPQSVLSDCDLGKPEHSGLQAQSISVKSASGQRPATSDQRSESATANSLQRVLQLESYEGVGL